MADFAQSDFKVTEDRFKDWSKPVIGHYTQTVWAETYQIGCGYIVYANKDKNATAANNKMKQSKITKTGGTGWATYYDVESVSNKRLIRDDLYYQQIQLYLYCCRRII